MTKFLLFSLMIVTSICSKSLVIGHRGASGYEPENTLRSFKRALDFGLPMIELDIHLSKSGQIVVVHDDTIFVPWLNKKQPISQLTWDELQKIDVGKGERMPLLAQVFDLIDRKLVINIEIKDPATVKPVAALIADYIQNKQWLPQHFLVTSFDHAALGVFHRYCPHVKTGVIFDYPARNFVKIAQKFGAAYIIMDYRSVTSTIINKAHQCGLQVFAYTVNNKQQARKLVSLAIDGIITDFPDILA